MYIMRTGTERIQEILSYKYNVTPVRRVRPSMQVHASSPKAGRRRWILATVNLCRANPRSRLPSVKA